MPPRDLNLRISDIIGSIEKIQNYVRHLGFADFSQDSKLVDSVLLNFIVIGEAANHIPEDITDAHPEIPRQKMNCATL